MELMTGRSFIGSFRAVAELNEDIERLYEESFGPRACGGEADAGWGGTVHGAGV